MLIPQKIILFWNYKNREYYERLGYVFTHWGDAFDVDAENLSPGSSNKVKIHCDYCLASFERTYSLYANQLRNSSLQKSSCARCKSKRAKETTLLAYGVENVSQLAEIKAKKEQRSLENYGTKYPLQNRSLRGKMKQTVMEKYGVDNVSKLERIKEIKKQKSIEKYGSDTTLLAPEVKAKIVKTLIEKFGVDHNMKSEVVRSKAKQTMLKRYGAENAFQSEVIKEKIKKTMIRKYGEDHPAKVPEIRERMIKTMAENGSIAVSRQQNRLHELIGGRLNYPLGLYPVDIALIDRQIYIEYDGGGHDFGVKIGFLSESDFKRKQQRRRHYLLKLGWREIRVQNPSDKLPSEATAKAMISQAIHMIECEFKDFVIVDFERFFLKGYQTKKKRIG